MLTVAPDFATAILLGALVGIEREKRKTEEEETHRIAGLRTVILLALLAAAAGWLPRTLLTPWVLARRLRRGGLCRNAILGRAQHRLRPAIRRPAPRL